MLAPVDASIGLPPAAIETTIRRRADPVQTLVDTISASVETIGYDVPSSVRGSVRAGIETIVDAIALPVQTLFDPIASSVRPVLDPIPGILSQSIAGDKDQDCARP